MECQQDVTLTTSSICTQPPLYSFPLTQLDLTACVRNSGILHSSLSRHSSVHKPGPLLCVHTFVPVHVKFICRKGENNNFTDWISSKYIHKDSANFSHSCVRIWETSILCWISTTPQFVPPIHPNPQSPPTIHTPTPYPHPYPLAIHTHYPHPHPLAIYSSPFLNSAKSLYPPSPSTTPPTQKMSPK